MQHAEINWIEQWQLHGFNFKDGFAHIDFSLLGIEKSNKWRKEAILLSPGPGFGDCSHPTTRLVLQMMPPHILDKSVLDLGCGSGVLALSAYAQGAFKVHGIDIDDHAVRHARSNASLNGCQAECSFSLPDISLKQVDVLLLNMIRSEQKHALQSLGDLQYKKIIASGVLLQERASYIEETSERGWHLVSEREYDGWLGFEFANSRHERM